jgi:PilZ domain
MRSIVDQQSVPPLATGATYDAVIAGGGPVSVTVERLWDEAVLARVAGGSVAQGDLLTARVVAEMGVWFVQLLAEEVVAGTDGDTVTLLALDALALESQRAFERSAHVGAAVVQPASGGSFAGETRDVSPVGIRFVSDWQPQDDDECDLVLDDGGEGGITVHLRAVRCLAQPDGRTEVSGAVQQLAAADWPRLERLVGRA